MMRRLSACLLLMLLGCAIFAQGEEIPMIRGSLGNIYGELTLPKGTIPVPLVILCHGFGGNLTGNQDYADYFVSHGFAVYNFDFCGGGMESRSEGTMLQMSVLTEAQDLNSIIDHFKGDDRFSRIILWGASQGGFVSAYVSAQRPSDIDRVLLEFPAIVLQDDAKKRTNPDGTYPDVSHVMGMTISRKYNEDAVSFDLYDLLPACARPVLILHGDQDLIVPLAYSERAAQVYPHASLVLFPGQGHGFTGLAREGAMKAAVDFFLRD